MAANDADTAYVAGGYGYPRTGPSVYKTTDGGDNWSEVFLTEHNRNIITGWAGDGGDFAWSFPEYALGFEVSLLDKNHLLVSDLSCLHSSDDGGKTWRQTYTTPAASRTTGQAPKGEAYASCGLEVTSIWQVLWFDENNLFACATDIRGMRQHRCGQVVVVQVLRPQLEHDVPSGDQSFNQGRLRRSFERA